jgi:hypothetical protein
MYNPERSKEQTQIEKDHFVFQQVKPKEWQHNNQRVWRVSNVVGVLD